MRFKAAYQPAMMPLSAASVILESPSARHDVSRAEPTMALFFRLPLACFYFSRAAQSSTRATIAFSSFSITAMSGERSRPVEMMFSAATAIISIPTGRQRRFFFIHTKFSSDADVRREGEDNTTPAFHFHMKSISSAQQDMAASFRHAAYCSPATTREVR